MRFAATLLASLIGAALLVSLGVWQLDRLEWKRGVLADMEAHLADEPAALPDRPDPRRDEYDPVRLAGTIDGRELPVLASTKERGPVHRIVSRFDAEDGRRVLLDRGTLSVHRLDTPRPVGAAEVRGNLLWPDERDRFTPANEDDLWYARDVAEMAEALGAEPILVVASEVRLASGAAPGVEPLPVGTEGIPNDHLGYAITWFGLAAAWIAIAGALLWRRSGGRPSGGGAAPAAR